MDVSRSAGVVSWEESVELDDTICVSLCDTTKGSVVLEETSAISIFYNKRIITYNILCISSITISIGNDSSIDSRRVC